jgi:hypothetical protein
MFLARAAHARRIFWGRKLLQQLLCANALDADARPNAHTRTDCRGHVTEPFPQTFALFVDMLGFAELVDAEGDELSSLSPIFTGDELYSPTAADNLLGYRFINFHRCLNGARTSLQDIGAGTAIVFSDSAFFRINTLEEAISVARSLMYSLVTNQVPARMGLAQGSFRFLRFLTDVSAQVSFHMSQFLGTGVVRAYKAETSGVPGLRILLHPNLEPRLDKEAMHIVPVGRLDGLKLDVQSEINYLEAEDKLGLGPDFADVIPFDCLRWMWGESDQKFGYHYDATYKALNMMRAQFRRDPYPWEKLLDRDKYDAEHGIRPNRPELPR